MLALLALLAFRQLVPPDSFMTPGVSHELARYRAAHIHDVMPELDQRRHQVASDMPAASNDDDA